MAKVELTDRARALRATQTEVEGLLWGRLRNRCLHGWKWKRQVPRGPYIVDFFCADAGLIVELDGSQHIEQAQYDDRRTAYLESLDLTVIRFWNSDVIENIEGVCETIAVALPLTPHPTLSPEGRGLKQQNCAFPTRRGLRPPIPLSPLGKE